MPKLIIGFMVTSLLYLYFIIHKDDDIVDRIKDRKPTTEEAWRRTIYVISRAFCSVYCGCLISVYTAKYILQHKLINYDILTKNDKDLYVLICVIFSFIFLRFIQNIIRLIQGRGSRPILDIQTMARNIRNWSN